MRTFTLPLVTGGLALTAVGVGVNHLRGQVTEDQPQGYARFGLLPGKYETSVEVGYMHTCESQFGDIEYCRCTLTKMTAAYTQANFLAVEGQMQQDPSVLLPVRMQKIFRTCHI